MTLSDYISNKQAQWTLINMINQCMYSSKPTIIQIYIYIMRFYQIGFNFS